MKKIILIITAAVCFTLTAPAADTRTAAEYRAIADQMLAAGTNRAAYSAIATSNDFWQITWRKDLADTRLAIDSDLAAAGMYGCAYYPAAWPKISKMERDVNGMTTGMPVRIALAAKYDTDMYSTIFLKAGAAPAELVAVLDETARQFADGRTYAGDRVMSDTLRALQGCSERVVRRHLRSQGKSFVTKDGVNPCATYMERLNAALNAPRFAGLNEWLAEMGIEASVDLSYLPTAAQVDAMKEAILDGDKELTERDKRVLSLCLGVEGYNAFVKTYNGD